MIQARRVAAEEYCTCDMGSGKSVCTDRSRKDTLYLLHLKIMLTRELPASLRLIDRMTY